MEKSDSSPRKYLKINLMNYAVGISHQFSNLFAIAAHCTINDLCLIVPYVRLAKEHNNNKEIISNLSEYIKYDTLKIDGVQLKYVFDETNIKKEDIIEINKKFTWDLVYKDIPFINRECHNVSFSYSDKIIDIAKNILNIIGEHTNIHVRRGDRITSEQINIDTHPENILEVAKKCNMQSVYIMTNEQTEFFNKLKLQSEYKFYFYDDFEILVNIKKEDNYMLFCIENEIANHSTKRVSTFKTDFSKYCCYLTDAFGWQ